MKFWGKYILVFFLTVGVFAVAAFVSSYINQRKLAEIQGSQDKVATDILSYETQFDLYENTSCDEVSNTYLTEEVSKLADEISYGEQNVGTQDQIAQLKKQYSILEVKDFLLAKRIGERCGKMPVTILYFYGTKDFCEDCVKQGYVLDAIRQTYPSVRIYSFDSTLDLSTVRALKSIYKVSDQVPTIVVDGTTFAGFQSLDQVSADLPKSVTNPPVVTPTTKTVVSSSKKASAK